ncbi:MAG TPA: hypothetical protein VGC84_19560 [Ilumatobacteraceae bacterium]
MVSTITVWQDDPGEPQSAGRTMTMDRPASLGTGPFPVTIAGKAPRPDITPGSEGMRYWTATSALHRARNVWLAAVAEAPKWQATRKLNVILNAGSEVNAYYDRGVLNFHVATVTDHDSLRQVGIATGESPDIVSHEFGHAVLDAIRPQLWDATFAEVAAFHESFGDISALLCALAVGDIEAEFAALSGSSVFQSSRVSRLGEQMGWGLRQQRPDLPDRTCLRDAVNTFFYVKPETLPTAAPSTGLSSEPHNFSRVFTAAFMRVLDEMLKAHDVARTPAIVRKVAATSAAMLIAAIRVAPVVDAYYHAVALAMVGDAARREKGLYHKAVTTAFVRTGIIAVAEAAQAAKAPKKRTTRAHTVGAAAIERGAAPPLIVAAGVMNLVAFGIDAELHLDLGEAGEVSPRRRGAVANTADDTGATITATNAAHFFVEDLFRRNRLDLTSDDRAAGVPLQNSKSATHTFHRADGALRIRRLRVDCGFDIT